MTVHAHVRDQLAAVAEGTFGPAFAPSWRKRQAEIIANRCVHVLVLLGVLPESDAAEPSREEPDHE